MFKLRFLIFGLCAFLPVLALHEYERRSLASASIKGHATAREVQIPAEVRSLRPNYPYSVIPGGVYSPAELRAAIQKDPLIREHYADFNLNSAQLVKLTNDQFQYASFRLKNRIFWTYKKLLIPKGEVLVTDGTNYARTRCGNRLSDVPKGNTTILQPADRLLSLPAFSLELLPQLSLADLRSAPESPVLPSQAPRAALFLPAAVAPALNAFANWPPIQQSPLAVPISAPSYVTTPLIPNRPGGPSNASMPSVLSPATPPPVPAVPEPGTISLFGVGLLVSFLLLHRMSRSPQLGHESKNGPKEAQD
ncbi:MAG: PEP-CTERM sorting domain-containing protein [Bryobacteraceae bacterium]